jgi:DNA-binding MarR family transcriptional regulator
LRLRALSEEAAHLASTLSTPAAETSFPPLRRRSRPNHSTGDVLRLLLEVRRLQNRHFPTNFFAGPAWDMLLDLMDARQAGRPVSVSSLGAGVDTSATSALRWIGVLQEAGLVRRIPDPEDRRRVLVELTEEGCHRMEVYLKAVRRIID